ncbi:MAG: glucose 1-dehydrogenase [Haliea sp.]|jgi:NAD(P)-dependent dehydrogenase (short-subunit alcohol dehydrogenase family)|nr:glucose 1-dehydrogenase [Haliea sp.]MDP5063219.1 glucose 1-dehydrogenase [Haliea sp.]
MQQVDLTGKVALVTGGSRGLGRAMSLGLAAAGAEVVVASRKLEACQAVVAEIEAAGGSALAVAAHTGRVEELDTLIAAALARFGRVDILINNAGISPAWGGLSELSPELFHKMFEVNTMGPWYLASRLAPHMGRQGGGIVVNVISVAALKPPANMGFYAASKAALQAMTKVMAAEWAPLNIRVNNLAPGNYHSDLFDSAAQNPEYLQGAIDATLQKRVAQTDEILGPLLYLVSDMSAFTTGGTLVSDGGFMVL